MTTIASRPSKVGNVPDVVIATQSVKIERSIPVADTPVHGWRQRLQTVFWKVVVKMYQVLAGPPMSERDRHRWASGEARARNHIGMSSIGNRPWW